jgi:putative hemolysin
MIDVVATLARPLIWFLGVSTNIVVRLLGGDPQAAREEVTDDELRAMVSESPSLGKEGRHIVDEVFAAGDRSLREVMVPRTEVEFLTADTTAAEAIARVERAPHSRYPITGSSVDDIEGFLHVRDLMNLSDEQRQAPIRELARPIVFLPGTVKVMHALTEMRRMSVHLAIVHDEYAGTAGIITMEDLVEELIGEIQDEYDPVAQPVVKAGDSLDMDGLMTLEQFSDLTGYVLPEGPYDTVAGFWVACHGQLPQKGDVITATLHRVGEADGPEASAVMTITEMDGRRAARIAVVIQPVEPTVESIKSSAKGSAKSSGKEKLSSKDRPSVKEKSA